MSLRMLFLTFRMLVVPSSSGSSSLRTTVLYIRGKGKGKVHRRTGHEGPEGDLRLTRHDAQFVSAISLGAKFC